LRRERSTPITTPAPSDEPPVAAPNGTTYGRQTGGCPIEKIGSGLWAEDERHGTLPTVVATMAGRRVEIE
jgi:hypothetical protein